MYLHNNTTTPNNQESFQPTWLYIKQHNKTGLKYFGKTVRDPHKYKGSGKYWLRHLKIYGNDVSTIWCQLFETKDHLNEYAIAFSMNNSIVESKEWANLIIEDGLGGGGVKGKITAIETKKKLSESLKGKTNFAGKTHTAETRLRISNARKGTIFNTEHKQKLSLAKKNKSWEEIFGVTEAIRKRKQLLLSNSKPVTINGFTYPSKKEAAKALNITGYYLNKLLTRAPS